MRNETLLSGKEVGQPAFERYLTGDLGLAAELGAILWWQTRRSKPGRSRPGPGANRVEFGRARKGEGDVQKGSGNAKTPTEAALF